MNISEIIQLTQTVSENKLTNLELEEGNMKLSLKCKKEQPQILTASVLFMGQASVQTVNTVMVIGTGVCPVPVREAPTLTTEVDIGSDKVIASPLMGAFYASSLPDAGASVKVDDTVRKGQVLDIIEAMKLMNEAENEYDGVVEAILASSEEVVEYDQPLFRIK